MKKFDFILMSTLLLSLLGLSSCIKDNDRSCGDADALTLHLNMSGKFDSGKTRAIVEEEGVDDYNENKLEALDVFFYVGNTLKWKITNSDIAYDSANKQATLPIPDSKRALFDGSTVFNVYVVANRPDDVDISTINEEEDNLSELRSLVVHSHNFVTDGGATAPESFVMDGVIPNKVINLNDPILGSVDLKRAAAKIMVRLGRVDIPGFTQEGTATVELMHFTDRSALIEGGAAPVLTPDQWRNIGPRNLDKPCIYNTNELTTTVPLYSYSNDWKTDPDRTTYVRVVIPIKNDALNIVENYIYKVPITPENLEGDEARYMNCITRNFLYDIEIDVISILGAPDEKEVELEANYRILDWSTKEVLVDIKASDYLVVSEDNVTMPNIKSYTLNFNSSIADVKLVPGSVKATYTFVDYASGQEKTEDVSSDQIPEVIVEPNKSSGTITINSSIPTNYNPKDIEFKVTDDKLTETVVVRQLPATYFTTTKGVRSYMPNEGVRHSLPTGLTNPYMYAITTLAPGGDIIWGFPPTDGQGQTVNNEDVSRMVSPKFEMASQFGASVIKTYHDGQIQCRGYTETAEDGTTKSGWRLPTAAEIAYIDKLQQGAPSGYMMTGRYYWSSWDQYPTQGVTWRILQGSSFYDAIGAYRMGKGIFDTYREFSQHYDSAPGVGPTSAHVRCIRDIKE